MFSSQSDNRFAPWSIIGFPDFETERDRMKARPQFASLNAIYELMKYHVFYFSLDSLLTQLSGEVAENRRSVFAEVGESKSFENLTQINQEVSRSEVLLNALEEDLAKHKESIKRYMERWDNLKSLSLRESSSSYLPNLFEEQIESRIELIRTQSSLTTRSIENEVSLKNIKLNFRLQRRIVLLTTGLLVLAFFQVYDIIPWSKLLSVFMKIPYYWSKIIQEIGRVF